MKNNRLTNEDILKLKSATERIKQLSSIDNCTFKNQHKIEVERVRLYLMYFTNLANSIDKILNGEQTEYYEFY